MARRSWRELKRERSAAFQNEAEAEYREGYEHARLAFELGQQVRMLREERGMTQAELAGRVGTSQPAIARLEAAGAEPKLETLERIGHALRMRLVVRFETLAAEKATIPAATA